MPSGLSRTEAMGQLGITDEISDDEWQSLVHLILG
jgi:hypothetical protein